MTAGCAGGSSSGAGSDREPDSPRTLQSSVRATVVTRILAAEFRNLQAVELRPGPGVNLLAGDNGQGKTNLMEALWLFTGEKSFRGARDGELVRFGQKFCRLELDFLLRGGANTASLAVGGGGKQATLGGVKLESASGLAGHFTAVVFSPEDLALVKGGPQERRRFLNAAIAQLYPRYGAELAAYANLLRQRNALLKDIPQHAELLDTLDIWDERLAALGGRLAAARLRYVARLSKAAAEIYKGIAEGDIPEMAKGDAAGDPQDSAPDSPERISTAENTAGSPDDSATPPAAEPGSEPCAPPETLEVSYACPYARGNAAGTPDGSANPPAAEIGGAHCALPLLEELRRRRRDDLEAGFTTVGPHRDDLELRLAGRAARLYASQGQQRSAVLALKLAEARVLTEVNGCSPVLLLDDVMSELDRGRQDYLLHHIGGAQVFITCCDETLFAGLASGNPETPNAAPRVFRVRGGEISGT